MICRYHLNNSKLNYCPALRVGRLAKTSPIILPLIDISITSSFCIVFSVFSVVNCSVLSVGHLVKTSPDSCVTSQMTLNTTCSFSCPHGYQLQGPSYKQCGANGQWTDSAKPVSCQGELKITGATEKTSSFYLFLQS